MVANTDTEIRQPPLRAVSPLEAVARGHSLVRWGASFAGSLTAIALAATVSALWYALAYGSGTSFIQTNLPWFFMGTVLGSLLLGGMLAGDAAGVRSATTGFLSGITVWALTLVAALVPLTAWVMVLANRGTGHPARTVASQISSNDFWALFATMAGGLLCALFGAMAGVLPGRRSRRVPVARDTTSAPPRVTTRTG